MTENPYIWIVILFIIGSHILSTVVDWLNLRHLKTTLPKEFEGFYDASKYDKSQRYLKENVSFGGKQKTFFLILTLGFLIAGGFNWWDHLARSVAETEIVQGLVFIGGLGFASSLLSVPFSIYGTFVIEEKYGFNKTTPKTFFTDLFKAWILGGLLGGLVLAGVIWFFQKAGTYGWFYAWGAISLFQIILMFIAPVLIMPLFNKFDPLEDGDLKTEIEKFANNENFKMAGIFTMDGSKRSTKSNAFFTGFANFKRIVLFDTLIKNHTVEELVAILAHEIGHYKKKHVLRFLGISLVSSFLMFYVLSLALNNPILFTAFLVEETSIYGSIVFIGIFYSPISRLTGLFVNILSRKYEFQADAYAVESYQKPEKMILALKKLSVENLSNLTPHPLKVFLEYSHPPVLERINAIRALKAL